MKLLKKQFSGKVTSLQINVPQGYVEINPVDANLLGIKPGDRKNMTHTVLMEKFLPFQHYGNSYVNILVHCEYIIVKL